MSYLQIAGLGLYREERLLVLTAVLLDLHALQLAANFLLLEALVALERLWLCRRRRGRERRPSFDLCRRGRNCGGRTKCRVFGAGFSHRGEARIRSRAGAGVIGCDNADAICGARGEAGDLALTELATLPLGVVRQTFELAPVNPLAWKAASVTHSK